jgi:hypothetical protein
MRLNRAIMLAAATAVVASCRESDARDIELSPATSGSPELRDTPRGTSARDGFGTIASGAEFVVRSPSKLCTTTHKIGDRVTTTVADGATGTAGASIPAGSTVTLEVTQSGWGRNDEKAVRFDFKVASVSVGGRTYSPVVADVTAPITPVRRQSTGTQAGKIATGAAIGAVIGQAVGKDPKGTIAGAAVGAAGGAVVAHKTADYDGCVGANAGINVRLTQPLQVRVTG